jgi:hypothetical protein
VRTLEQEMKQLLLQMLMVSEGTTANLNATGKGESEAVLPVGGHDTLVEYWSARWEVLPIAETVEAARSALEAYVAPKHPKVKGESEEELAARVAEEGEGLSLKEAALKFRATESFCRRARVAQSREGEFGKPYRVPEAVSRDERVLFLLDKNVSVRAVAAQIGMHAKQVQRIKARRAA